MSKDIEEFGKFTEEELNGIELEMEEKNFFYSYNMIFELGISEHAKILYLYLCRKANDKSVSFPSYASMGRACSMSRTTAIRALKELMAEGLVIKKRQGNGTEQTVNKYMIFAEPKDDLKSKNQKQMKRELEEYRAKRSGNDISDEPSGESNPLEEGSVRETPGGKKKGIIHKDVREEPGSVREGPGSVRETPGGIREEPEEGSVREGPGGVRERPGSVREEPEVQPIEVLDSSSSLFNGLIGAGIKMETVQLVKSIYQKMLLSKSKTMAMGKNILDTNEVVDVLKSLNAAHIRQVCQYVERTRLYSVNAIKAALYNSPEEILLQEQQKKQGPYQGNTKNKFNDFPQRTYDFEKLESALLTTGMETAKRGKV